MRQRNDTGADLLVQGEPPFVLAAGAEVDHPNHIIGCVPIEQDEPAPEETPAEAIKPAARRAQRTEISEGDAR